MKTPIRSLLAILFLTFLLPSFAHAQDSNFLFPISEIERCLQYEPFEIFQVRDSRFAGDITKRVTLKFADSVFMQVKWKRAPKDGWGVNNEPRYEIAAYQLQKLFLEPPDYVVPPTLGRSLPLEAYRALEPEVGPTFKNTACVFFVLQYWLQLVSQEGVYNQKRLSSDSTYARHLADMNILSYLIDHKDSNIGNFLISMDPKNPRVFVVDNSMAFASLESNRGYEWRKLRVKHLPVRTIARLRKITKEELEKALGVVAQFEINGGQLVPVAASDCLDKNKGVRQKENLVQFGLTSYEINGVRDRLQKLLRDVDSGKITTF
jgi:hypothetical protein